ncbi:MAG: hypothetical protein QXQ14_01990 [Candidatus Aenigmatarchaeota archaeon]
MKSLTNFEIVISLSLFLGAFTLISLIFLNTQSAEIVSMKNEKNVIKSLIISQFLLYSNSSFSLSTLNYTILSQQKVSNFFNFCNSNKDFIKNFFNVSNFNITLSCGNNVYTCSNQYIAQAKITRVATMNNLICYLSVSVE